MTEIPTFSECVIGFRQWKIDVFGTLRPLTLAGAPWHRGVNAARCLYGSFMRGQLRSMWASPPPRQSFLDYRHDAPHAHCLCGLYVMHDLVLTDGYPNDDEIHTGIPVWGAVAAFGRLEVHHSGFRAEKAGVTALALQPEMSDAVRAIVGQVARSYGVPCVPIDVLAAEAQQHGAPLPMDVRPPEERPDELTLQIARQMGISAATAARAMRQIQPRSAVRPVTPERRRTPKHVYAVTIAIWIALIVVAEGTARAAFGEGSTAYWVAYAAAVGVIGWNIDALHRRMRERMGSAAEGTS